MHANTIDTPASTGGFAAREVLRVTCFVRRPHAEIESLVADAITLALQTFPPPALSMISDEGGNWIRDDLDGLSSRVRDDLIGRGRAINGRVSLSGDQANIPDYELDYAGKATDRPPLKDANCVLELSVAASLPYVECEKVLALQRRWIAILCPDFSYIDLALRGQRRLIQGLARRYHALDISDPRIVARDLGDKLPGVFWRNFIGSKLLGQLGGVRWCEGLSEHAAVDADVDGGVWVTLGPAPVRGDVNRGEGFADRQLLARRANALRLLHVPRKIRYFEAVDGMSDLEAQESWHLRWTS